MKLRTFGHFWEQAPKKWEMFHLGATSCFVTANAYVFWIHNLLNFILSAVWGFIWNLAQFARYNASVATFPFTHSPLAQPTTTAKKVCLWQENFLYDAPTLERIRDELQIRGVKCTTGSHASFLLSFYGNNDKVRQFQRRVVRMLDLEVVAGQY